MPRSPGFNGISGTTTEVRRDGSLATTRLEDAVACLIQASARTDGNTCAWCQSFGILDLLEKQIQSPTGQARPQLMRDAVNRLNQTWKCWLVRPVES